MPPPPLLSEEVASDALYIASLQPTCSSSSSGISCTHSDNPDADDDDNDASSDKAMEASDSAWTDSKHSSYLNFMEENFVRDLYEREYCALDVCGESSHRHHVDDPDTAESRIASPFGLMEFKVWENGNWTRRPDSKRRVHPCTLLSSPWVKHFRTKACCGSDMNNITLPRNKQGDPRTLFNHHLNNINSNPGPSGTEISSPLCRGDSEPEEAKDCILRSQKSADVDSEQQGSSIERRDHFSLDEGSMTIGVFGEVCKLSDEVDSHYCHA